MYKLLESPTKVLRGPEVSRGFSRCGRIICQNIEVEFWRVAADWASPTLRAQPRIPPPPSNHRAPVGVVGDAGRCRVYDVEHCGSSVSLRVDGRPALKRCESTNDWKVLCFRKATRSAQVASGRPLGVWQWPLVQCACVSRVIFFAAARPAQQSRWANRLPEALPLLSPFPARRHFGHIILGKMKTI